MTIYETLSILFQGGLFLLTLLIYVDNKNTKK